MLHQLAIATSHGAPPSVSDTVDELLKLIFNWKVERQQICQPDPLLLVVELKDRRQIVVERRDGCKRREIDLCAPGNTFQDISSIRVWLTALVENDVQFITEMVIDGYPCYMVWKVRNPASED